jgi:predicted metalloprotease with PDZ domain
MSRMAPFTDGDRPIDRTNWSNTVISYYMHGGAVALALDLTLRDRSDGRVTLDDYMRAMWRVHGRPGGALPGYVDRPYTIADAQARLAEVAGDAAFAREFFGRYIHGTDVPDFERLLARAALVLRKANPNGTWWGDVRWEPRDGALNLVTVPPSNSPLYLAGLDQGDTLRQIDGTRVTSTGDVAAALQRRKPGDQTTIVFGDRSGASRTVTIVLGADPTLELVPLESAGQSPTPAQKAFRDRWLR